MPVELSIRITKGSTVFKGANAATAKAKAIVIKPKSIVKAIETFIRTRMLCMRSMSNERASFIYSSNSLLFTRDLQGSMRECFLVYGI